MSKEKIIDMIAKILAKADKSRNPSHEEAESAILMAQRLMAKHGIESHEVEAYTAEEDEIVESNIKQTRNQELPSIFLASIIADNFRVKFYTAIRKATLYHKRVSTIRFLGKKMDVEIASKVYAHAHETMERECERFTVNATIANAIKSHPKVIRHNFKLGFGMGLKEKLAKQVESECMALVLKVDSKVEEAFDKLGTFNKKEGAFTPDLHAQMHGYQQGKNYNYTSGELK